MRRFSVRPAITFRGRTFKGLRGWAGKPLHPPLTDIPVGAYLLAAGFDVISAVGGDSHDWARELWHAGTFAFVGGVVVSVLAALTGFWDWWRSSEPGTQARRTINTHAWIMLTVTALAVIHTRTSTPVGIVVISVVVAALVALGSTYGGTLVFDYGFYVETAGDHPVWHKSEQDVLPGRHD
ncbi:MAG: DUF2231 domain-containing protein [Actinobacteria bacterium]|nr:MAG: DUF2231 domain-containing protein [Actinomycetota bacterium]